MQNKFDELTRDLAQSVTRRQALRRFGVGLAGVALAMLGLPDKSQAGNRPCSSAADCGRSQQCCNGVCIALVDDGNCAGCGHVCPPGTHCKQYWVTDRLFGHYREIGCV